MSEIPSDQLELLRQLSTDDTPHSRSTLFSHLSGTRALLEQWGNDVDVCAAGLFHSIYGTEAFRTESASFDERDRVTAVIGERAERLAHAFCVTHRREFFDQLDAEQPRLSRWQGDGEVEVSPADVRDLVEIEVANAVEQLPAERVEDHHLRWLQAMAERGAGHMSPGAAAALDQLLAEVAAASP